MRLNKTQLIPIVFPPGAGGHFLWQLLTLHPQVMPLDKDQTMQKLLKDRSLQDQIERIKKNVVPHDQWQKNEGHHYYVAPPDYSKNELAEWVEENQCIDVQTGDDYFFNKINKPEFLYGMIVHRERQFPLINKLDRCIGFDNFMLHLKNSQKKVSNIFDDVNYSQWRLGVDCFVFEPDKFYYDWNFAQQSLHELYSYLGINCDNIILDATKEVWNCYRSMH